MTRRVLAISSWVGAGHVGLCAAAPVLSAMGCEVLQLPTVVLSNHYGWPAAAGAATPPAQLRKMLAAMAANGWLEGLDAVLTGYLPSAAHVEFAVEAVGAATGAMVVVDPVLGDDPGGLYIDQEAAAAVRDRLAPLADVLTPNRFELEYLSGQAAVTLDEIAMAAAKLEGRLIVTSAPAGAGRIGAWDSAARQLYAAPFREGAPKGVGDAFAALIAAGLDTGAALGRLDGLIRASLGADHLRISDMGWRDAPPVPAEAGR